MSASEVERARQAVLDYERCYQCGSSPAFHEQHPTLSKCRYCDEKAAKVDALIAAVRAEERGRITDGVLAWTTEVRAMSDRAPVRIWAHFQPTPRNVLDLIERSAREATS